jgi:hypothetical protein
MRLHESGTLAPRDVLVTVIFEDITVSDSRYASTDLNIALCRTKYLILYHERARLTLRYCQKSTRQTSTVHPSLLAISIHHDCDSSSSLTGISILKSSLSASFRPLSADIANKSLSYKGSPSLPVAAPS